MTLFPRLLLPLPLLFLRLCPCSAGSVIKCPAASNSSCFNSNGGPKNGFSKKPLANNRAGSANRALLTGRRMGPGKRAGEQVPRRERACWRATAHGRSARAAALSFVSCSALGREFVTALGRASAALRVLLDRSHIPVERHLQLWHSQCRLGPSAGSRIVRYLSCDVASTKHTILACKLSPKKRKRKDISTGSSSSSSNSSA